MEQNTSPHPPERLPFGLKPLSILSEILYLELLHEDAMRAFTVDLLLVLITLIEDGE